jgi:hypothetical protein
VELARQALSDRLGLDALGRLRDAFDATEPVSAQ